MHRVQFRFPFLPASICLTMAHLIENCRFSFFRFNPRRGWITPFRGCTSRCVAGDFKLFLYLVLKSLAVTPMYVCKHYSSEKLKYGESPNGNNVHFSAYWERNHSEVFASWH